MIFFTALLVNFAENKRDNW